MRITVAAPAKINLWLRVGPVTGDGYHELSTLFCGLDLADTVTLGTAGPDREPGLDLAWAPPLESLPDLGPDDRNLALRAARAFLAEPPAEQAEAGRGPGGGAGDRGGAPHIRLLKRIPTGGGLGGGSSDAGAVLRGMRRLHPRRVKGQRLAELAAELGSDVPFFLLGTPLAVATGRGEWLTPLKALTPRPVVLVLPPFPVSTAEAFGWLDQDGALRTSEDLEPADALEGGADGIDWSDVVARAENDFEPVVFRRHPELREMRDALRDQGAEPALLSGSGSTLFGVFSDDDSAHRAASALRSAHPDATTLVTRTRLR